MKRINIGGFNIDVVNINDACELVYNYISNTEKNKKAIMVQAVNTDTIVKANINEELKAFANKADLALADGMPLVWASKFSEYKLEERVGGPDFFEEFNKIAHKNKISYYFLGCTEEVTKLLIENLKEKYPNIDVKGYFCPPFSDMEDEKLNDDIINRINKINPDIVWVSFGCPKQEKWIVKHKDRINTSMIMGIGAVFQFYAGTIKRAPVWLQKIGLEWFYRFLQEPKRLFRRYFIEGPRFIRYFIKYRNKKELI